MKRLVFIVEGDTEIILVRKIIEPYLNRLGFYNPVTVQTIVTNRKQHKKGGVSSYGKFHNEIKHTLAQRNVIVTTIIDFFKLPTDFPQYTSDSLKINQIEEAILADFEYTSDLIPYIQRHELEALMSSDRSGFELIIDDKNQLKEIDAITDRYKNPEDNNNSPETAPSKRLASIFNYDKISDARLIFEMLTIE